MHSHTPIKSKYIISPKIIPSYSILADLKTKISIYILLQLLSPVKNSANILKNTLDSAIHTKHYPKLIRLLVVGRIFITLFVTSLYDPTAGTDLPSITYIGFGFALLLRISINLV